MKTQKFFSRKKNKKCKTMWLELNSKIFFCKHVLNFLISESEVSIFLKEFKLRCLLNPLNGKKPLYFRFPNVLILTTSNITGAIDLAFVDR